MSGRQQRVMVQPIVRISILFRLTPQPALLPLWQNVIFKNLQQVRTSGWHYHAL